MSYKPQHGATANGSAPNKRKSIVLPVLGIIVGMALLVGPLAADLYESWQNGKAISTMSSTLDTSNDADMLELKDQANIYNRSLAGTATSEEIAKMWPYDQQLNLGDEDAVSWLEIPKTGMKIPIYKGTDDDTLASGAGIVEGTSLPVGGESTHCVIAGHSGMYNNRMFDDIRQLEVGDLFALHTLGDEIVYKVTSIIVVLPEEVSSLQIQSGEDLCTLVTCTPYGVNDHRLLVTGERTDEKIVHNTAAQNVAAYAKSTRAWPIYAGIAILAFGFIVSAILRRRKKKKQGQIS